MDGSASFLVFRSRRLNESIRFTFEEGRHHRQGDRERTRERKAGEGSEVEEIKIQLCLEEEEEV